MQGVDDVCAPDAGAGGAGGILTALGRNAVGDGNRRDSPRLRAHDAAGAALPRLDRRIQQELGHLPMSTTNQLFRGCRFETTARGEGFVQNVE